MSCHVMPCHCCPQELSLHEKYTQVKRQLSNNCAVVAFREAERFYRTSQPLLVKKIHVPCIELGVTCVCIWNAAGQTWKKHLSDLRVGKMPWNAAQSCNYCLWTRGDQSSLTSDAAKEKWIRISGVKLCFGHSLLDFNIWHFLKCFFLCNSFSNNIEHVRIYSI